MKGQPAIYAWGVIDRCGHRRGPYNQKRYALMRAASLPNAQVVQFRLNENDMWVPVVKRERKRSNP